MVESGFRIDWRGCSVSREKSGYISLSLDGLCGDTDFPSYERNNRIWK